MATVPLHDGPRVDLDAVNAQEAGGGDSARVTWQGAVGHGPARVDSYQLGNGLDVLIWEDHRAPVFAYQTWFRVGSRHEKRGRTGIAHLFEHLMFKATDHLEEGEFDRLMEEHGAQTNAATWVDWTYYREKLPAGNLELVCRLEADRMEHMILNESQLESEREVVVNERLLRVDNDPDGKLYERLYHLAFGDHPYGWPTIGWMEDIRAISLEDCLAFYRHYYAPNNATLVLVGDVDSAEALATIRRFYGHMERQDVPEEAAFPDPVPPAERRATLDLPLTSDKGIYAWYGLAVGDPRHATLEVLDEILTGGESSRLYKTLVTELELATQAGGWVPSWRHPGLYEIGLTMRPGVPLSEGEAVLDRLLAELQETPVGERELEKAQNSLEADFYREIAETGGRARGLGDAATTRGDFRAFFSRAARLREVTADAVQTLAREIFAPDHRTVVVGRPAAGGES